MNALQFQKIIGHAGKHDEFCFNAHSEQGRRAGFDAGYNTKGVGQSEKFVDNINFKGWV